MKAFVFINVKAGKAQAVVKKASKIQEVKSVNACWGRPDLIATVEVTNEKALTNLVLSRIQKINGVEETDTHIVIEE